MSSDTGAAVVGGWFESETFVLSLAWRVRPDPRRPTVGPSFWVASPNESVNSIHVLTVVRNECQNCVKHWCGSATRRQSAADRRAEKGHRSCRTLPHASLTFHAKNLSAPRPSFPEKEEYYRRRPLYKSRLHGPHPQTQKHDSRRTPSTKTMAFTMHAPGTTFTDTWLGTGSM